MQLLRHHQRWVSHSKVRQHVINTVASVVALTFPVVSAVAAPELSSPPPPQQPSSPAFEVVIPQIYENLPEDPSAANGILDLLDEIEKTIAEIRDSPETLKYLEEELSTLQND